MKPIPKWRRHNTLEHFVRLVGASVIVPSQPHADAVDVDVDRENLTAEAVEQDAFCDLARYTGKRRQVCLDGFAPPALELAKGDTAKVFRKLGCDTAKLHRPLVDESSRIKKSAQVCSTHTIQLVPIGYLRPESCVYSRGDDGTRSIRHQDEEEIIQRVARVA